MYRRSLAALAGALLLAACSTGSGGSPASPTGATDNTLTIGLAASSAGDHMVGGDGHALYILTTDSANTSTCDAGCAANWPPLTVAAGQAPAAGAGVTAQLATITRSDGSLQVTANGMPLYTYGGDARSTDINGQGKGGVWFLAGATGAAVGAGGSPSSKPSSSDDGYY
jgi:predicted lipoprotein with Yx(FWY)xxD motif